MHLLGFRTVDTFFLQHYSYVAMCVCVVYACVHARVYAIMCVIEKGPLEIKFHFPMTKMWGNFHFLFFFCFFSLPEYVS